MTALGNIPANRDVATSNDAVPSGVLMPNAAGTVPSGWLACDGALVSTTTYGALYAVIGHKYNGGVDPGGGQFRLPNLRRVFPAGIAASGGLAGSTQRSANGGGAKLGAWDHTHAAGTLAAASHQHSSGDLYAPGHGHSDDLYMGDHAHTIPYGDQKIHNSNNTYLEIIRNNGTYGCGNIGLPGGISACGNIGTAGATDYAAPGFTGSTAAANPAHQFMDYVIKT